MWKQFNHPNLLAFLGVNPHLFFPTYCLISPWMAHGNVKNFVQSKPDFDRLEIVSNHISRPTYLLLIRNFDRLARLRMACTIYIISIHLLFMEMSEGYEYIIFRGGLYLTSDYRQMFWSQMTYGFAWVTLA